VAKAPTIPTLTARLLKAGRRFKRAAPFAFEEYLELVDWTGRAVRAGKRGHIPSQHAKILDRLGIDAERFIEYSERLLKEFGTAVGAPAAMANLSARRQTKYLHGIRVARRMFVPKRAAWEISWTDIARFDEPAHNVAPCRHKPRALSLDDIAGRLRKPTGDVDTGKLVSGELQNFGAP
jgi:hypothetical protein